MIEESIYNKKIDSDPLTKQFILEDKMLLFITLTQRCQLNCVYCGNGTNKDIEELAVQVPEINYDINLLKKFRSVKELVVCFYGGEPLFRINLIEEIIPMLPHAIFCLQTNGLLLRSLKPDIIKRLDTILVSVDGDEKINDTNRGKGTYKKVIKNVKFIKENLNFKGDLIARMTCSGVSDIYKAVTHLLGTNLFNHVHWQLDCEWDETMNTRYTPNFSKWRDDNYNPGITKLFDEFVENLKKGKVLGIVPFLGLLNIYLKGQKIKRIMCGSGSTAFNVTTGGFINSCPIAPAFDPILDLRNEKFDHRNLYDSQLIGGSCLDCEIFEKCGGRCLYSNKAGWWGEEGHKEVCNTIFHLVRTIEGRIDEIKEIIKNVNEGKVENVDIKEFNDLLNYPKYNNSTEIIP